jgi:hypothetical protein
VQFWEGVFPEFSLSLPLTNTFEDENEAPCDLARSSEGRRYRKQPKIDALRQYKEEILEAHRSALRASDRADFPGAGCGHFRAAFGADRPAICRRRRAGGGKVSTAEGHPESAAPEAMKPNATVTYQIVIISSVVPSCLFSASQKREGTPRAAS